MTQAGRKMSRDLILSYFQVLVAPRNCDLTWVDASNGHIPTGAFQGGFNEDNDPLYIGRARHEDSYAVGKINAEHGCCYIPYGGEEIAKEEYQVTKSDLFLININIPRFWSLTR